MINNFAFTPIQDFSLLISVKFILSFFQVQYKTLQEALAMSLLGFLLELKKDKVHFEWGGADTI